MSEVMAKDLRKKLIQFFVYAQNHDEKLMHLLGVEEEILDAFDEMAEKAELLDKFLKLQEKYGDRIVEFIRMTDLNVSFFEALKAVPDA